MEELSSNIDGSGIGTLGEGFAMGLPIGKMRLKQADGRAESAPLVRGRQKGDAYGWSAESAGPVENFKGTWPVSG